MDITLLNVPSVTHWEMTVVSH